MKHVAEQFEFPFTFDGGPSVAAMKNFASRFSKSEWEKLCKNPTFMEEISYDIGKCRITAEKILAGKAV